MRKKDKIRSALELVAKEAESLARRTKSGQSAQAFWEVADMLEGMAADVHSPLFAEVSRRLRKNGKGNSYRQARRAARAIAVWSMKTRIAGTKYRAAMIAQEITGISRKVFERELPKADEVEAFLSSDEATDIRPIVDTIETGKFDEWYEQAEELKFKIRELLFDESRSAARRQFIERSLSEPAGDLLDTDCLLASLDR